MKRRSSFDENLSKRLRKPSFAQNFIQELIEGDEGLDPEDALRTTIEIMGIKEFAKLANVPTARVHEFLDGKKIKPETLDNLLKPFKLKTKIVFEEVA